MEKAKAALRFSIPKHIATGLENVARVVEEEGVRGCVFLFVCLFVVWVVVMVLVCGFVCVWGPGGDPKNPTPPTTNQPIKPTIIKIRYYGPVYDLITLKDPKFTQAVEVRLCLFLPLHKS